MKMRFLTLLINFLNCKIDVKCEKDEKIDKLVVIVKRNNFENVNFDFETISIHVTDFFDIVFEITNEINNVIIVTTKLFIFSKFLLFLKM